MGLPDWQTPAVSGFEPLDEVDEPLVGLHEPLDGLDEPLMNLTSLSSSWSSRSSTA
jgi:hypothetical protein